MKTYANSTKWKLEVPFFLLLAVLTIVSFIIPLRPTQSQMEKRNLSQFPSFTWDGLTSGTYFDEITLWFSDTFPGREEWLKLSSYIESIHGYSEIAFTDDIDLTTAQAPQKAQTTLADLTKSLELEKALPTVTEPSLLDKDTTTQSSDTALKSNDVPEQNADEWTGIDAGEDTQIELGDGALIQIGDSVFNQVGFSDKYSQQYAKTVSSFADFFAGKEVRIISAPAPTAVGILVDTQYQEKLNCADQNTTISYMHSKMSDNVIKVDTYAALVPHNDEYIYFRTDHHWTALGAYYTYVAICEAVGMEPASLDSFQPWDQGEFEGSLYWRAPKPAKLKLDQVTAYVPQGDIDTLAYSANGSRKEHELLVDMSQHASNEKYLTFLGTDYAMTEITNNSLPDGATCLVIKDSFGNAMIPFLTQNYHKIYAVDYRKYTTLLRWFVEYYDVDDVIFTPYVVATQSINGNKLISFLCQ